MSQGEGKAKDLGETSGVRENSSLHDLIKSFQQNINNMERKSKIPYSRPTIVSRKETLVESVQSYQKPSLLSIGSLHRGEVNLQPMEDFKWSFVCIILSSIGSSIDKKLSGCFVKLKELEEKSRRTYSVFIGMTSDDFVRMLFLDTCFIILLTLAELGKQYDPVKPDQSTLSQEQKCLLSDSKIIEILKMLRDLNVDELDQDVTRDVFILENQIPFFILEHMWKWFIKTLDIKSKLDFLGCHYFVQSERIKSEKIHHYLHLYHCCFVPAPSPNFELCDRYNRPWIPSATELKESGIDFRLENHGGISLDITFNEGVVHIPEKFLDEDDRAKVENVVDFEQSVRGDYSTLFSNYVWIMSRLLSKEDDVRILQEGYDKGWDKDVQRFFSNLERRCSYWKVGDEVKTMCTEIKDYRSSGLVTLKASIKRKLCSSLWVTLSIAGAVVLFILTFLQTFFAMYSYFHPPS